MRKVPTAEALQVGAIARPYNSVSVCVLMRIIS